MYSWRFYVLWVDLLALLQDLRFIWVWCFGQREQCYVNKKKGSEVLRNKIFSQNTYPTTVKPCSYISLMTRNRCLEMTVPDWKGVTVLTQQSKFFCHVPSGKVFQHCKTTIYYSGLPYVAFVIFALDIPCTTPEIQRKFPSCIVFI